MTAKEIVKKIQKFWKEKPHQRPDKKVEEDVVFWKQVPVHPRNILARDVRDQFDGLETVDYNNDTNISDLGTKKKSGKQIAARKIVKKYINFARKKPYQKPDKKVEEHIVFLKQVALYPRDRLTRKARVEFDNLETVYSTV